eukprot:scaffold206378_cov22-Prasinocladus_malaysianus.AAC.1
MLSVVKLSRDPPFSACQAYRNLSSDPMRCLATVISRVPYINSKRLDAGRAACVCNNVNHRST